MRLLLRRVSATTFGLSTFASPLLTIAEYSNLAVVGTMMGAAVLTSGLSTLLVQYCVNPYVTQISLAPSSLPPPSSTPSSSSPPQTAIVQTLTFFGNVRHTAVRISDIVPASDRAFASWRVREGAVTSDDADPALLRDLEAAGKVRPSARFKRTRFYVHPELDEGFSPDMGDLVRAVNRHGRAASAAATAGGGDGPVPASATTGDAVASKAWDDVVKDLRKGSKA
ncbi:hypothetical protein HKX48_005807 [Thoreauomyces humboldtii]|nr:hypothetical protein HKX48_005807 [Thoreauomyces humboldtii]